MNLSQDKTKILDRRLADSTNAPAKPAMDGGIDYFPPTPRARDCDYTSQVHTHGGCSIQIRMPKVPSKKLVSVVSSRIGINTDQKSDWFDALRTFAIQQRNENLCVLTATPTTTFPYLCRLSELYGFELMVLVPSSTHSPLKPSGATQSCPLKNFPNATARYASYHWQNNTEIQANSQQNVDQLIIDLAEECFVISCRKNGRVYQAVKDRLQKGNSKSTRLLINRRLTPKRTSVELTNLGAIPWWLYELRHLNHIPESDSQDSLASNEKQSESVIKFTNDRPRAIPRCENRQFLIHWTRQSTGPWPGQPYREFLDDLLFRSPTRGEGGLSTLKRILAQQIIKGTNTLTRGTEKVTCFTSTPLSQYADRRIFRSHLSRWDFEHYGIAIDCEFLKRLGARPVHYGTDTDWSRLSNLDRPFFQLEMSTGTSINWEAEKEWRIRGDLELKNIPRYRAFVFVKKKQERTALQKHSRWPVVSVEDLKNLNLHR